MPSANGDSPVTLAAYAASRRNAGPGRWVDSLPVEIVDEIMASTAGGKDVSDRLRLIGYEDATPKKCEQLTLARPRT